MVYLNSRLDELKGQLSEKESSSLQELENLKGELEEKETQMKTMEAELNRKWKALEQARSREDKLIHRLQHVREYTHCCIILFELFPLFQYTDRD